MADDAIYSQGPGNPVTHLKRQPGGSMAESTSMGRGNLTPEMPSEGKAQPAHMGSQSSAPGKEDPIGERGSGYSGY